MFQRNATLVLATSGGNLTCLTGAGYLCGFYFYASAAAATLTIADSARTIFSWSGPTAAAFSFVPVYPIACTGGLSVTNSGAGTYSIMFATQ